MQERTSKVFVYINNILHNIKAVMFFFYYFFLTQLSTAILFSIRMLDLLNIINSGTDKRVICLILEQNDT